MKRTHRLLSLLLTFLMVWALLPTAVFAEDTRTVITGITAVGADKPVRPEYGERITIPSFRVIDGEPAYFFTDNYDSKWEKKEGDTWRAIPLYSSETFTEGVYRFSCQVRISMKETFNGKNAATLKLPALQRQILKRCVEFSHARVQAFGHIRAHFLFYPSFFKYSI